MAPPAPHEVVVLLGQLDEHSRSLATWQHWVRALLEALGWSRLELDTAGPLEEGIFSLNIGGATRLFVEAVPPGTSESSSELRRLGWSAHHEVVALVTSRGVELIDCRARAQVGAPHAVITSVAHADLATRWGEVANLLARDAVARGSLEALGAKPRGTRRERTAVESFLAQVTSWRSRLPERGGERTLEQLLFLRLAAERLGNQEELAQIARSSHPRDSLRNCFRAAQERFDPLFFAPHEDDLATTSDDAVRDIVRELTDPRSIYAFSAFPLDLLGRVHEHFLQTRLRNTRKSGGVYYTPDYVVRYILESTLGAVLRGATPDEVTSLSVLDPACGSGSFLVAAFQMLIEWHRHWYLRDGIEKHAGGERPSLVREARGAWRLAGHKVREIAQKHLFGVDIDPHAVQITRLSLLLMSLSRESPSEPLSLDANIVRGNSLLDSDFDYPRAFPQVFARGGFDVVIGNPPYLSYGGRQLVDIDTDERAHFAANYECSGWPTAHSFFMERSAKRLSRRLTSFIVPDQVGHLDGYRSLRELMTREGALTEVKYWGEDIFKGVVSPSLSFILDKVATSAATRIVNADGSELAVACALGAPWTGSPSGDLVAKLRTNATSIRSLLSDCGMRTTHAKGQVVKLEDAEGEFVAALEGKQIGRYWCAPPSVAVRLDSGRPMFRAKDAKYERAKFVIRQTAPYPIVGPREHALHFRNSLHALYEPSVGPDVRFVVALLNSKLLRFAYVTTVREAQQRVFPQVKLGPLGRLPIRNVDLSDATERARHDRIVNLVEALLALQREQRADTCSEETRAARRAQIDALDEQIDAEVFALYELTPPDIAQVLQVVDRLPPPP